MLDPRGLVAIGLAAIALLQVLLLTLTQAHLTAKKEQRDYARQDLVAQRLERRLKALDDQGKAIHVLVNSDMTAARTAERAALKLLVIAIRKTNGHTPDEQKEIQRVEERIEELDQILADRLAAQREVDAEADAKKVNS